MHVIAHSSLITFLIHEVSTSICRVTFALVPCPHLTMYIPIFAMLLWGIRIVHGCRWSVTHWITSGLILLPFPVAL